MKNKILEIVKETEETSTLDTFLNDFIKKVEEAGIKTTPVLDIDSTRFDYEKIWEHGMIKRYNENAHVMASYFMTIYSREEGAGEGWGIGGFYPIPAVFLTFGRIGNTHCIAFGEYK
jgi:hypothetical protein